MTTKTLTKAELQTLARQLRRSGAVLTIRTEIVEDGPEKDLAIRFTGGRGGSHQIWANVSSKARILAHFEGYLANNGFRFKPRVGEKVVFYHSSAGQKMGGVRTGVVLKVGTQQARIEFKYNYGRVTQYTCPFGDIHGLLMDRETTPRDVANSKRAAKQDRVLGTDDEECRREIEHEARVWSRVRPPQ